MKSLAQIILSDGLLFVSIICTKFSTSAYFLFNNVVDIISHILNRFFKEIHISANNKFLSSFNHIRYPFDFSEYPIIMPYTYCCSSLSFCVCLFNTNTFEQNILRWFKFGEFLYSNSNGIQVLYLDTYFASNSLLKILCLYTT